LTYYGSSYHWDYIIDIFVKNQGSADLWRIRRSHTFCTWCMAWFFTTWPQIGYIHVENEFEFEIFSQSHLTWGQSASLWLRARQLLHVAFVWTLRYWSLANKKWKILSSILSNMPTFPWFW
jgi:hypothetical protein